jgi:long-chain acyl-CoA synthetase
MKPSDSLLDAWSKTLHQRRNDPAVFDEKGQPRRSFQEIAIRAEEWADRLNVFQPNAVIGVQVGNHPDWPSILLATRVRSLVVLPLDRTINSQDRSGPLQVCRASGLITIDQQSDGADMRSAPVPALKLLQLTGQPIRWDGPAPALLKLTSGTTATPRAVRFRTDQLIADCVQICNTMGITERDLNFAVIPVSHSYGFSNLLTPLLVRGVALALSSDRLPRAIIANLQSSRATVFAGMPVFYQAFLDLEKIPDLPNLRLCISAGAPLPSNVGRRFKEKFGLPIHSFYGSSECGGICYDRHGNAADEGFVGTPMDGVKIELIERETDAGQIRVRSAAVGDGYFPEPNETKLGHGIFVPDDLLTESDNGWKIVGRVSDLINVAGKKVNPAEVEAELLNVPGVREAIVFGRKSSLRHEEVAACVVASSDVSENDLLRMCRQRLSGWQVPKRIFLLDQLPVNERGKISRRELAAQFAKQ